MNTDEQVCESVVAISTRKFPEGEGLGVLCGQWVFTCAHYFEALVIDLKCVPWLEVWRISDGTKGTFAMLYASTMDFMILAPDGMTSSSSEAGGTESSWDVIIAAEERCSSLRPTEVVFQSGATAIMLPGFFFGPNGKTRHKAEFELHKDSAIIGFYSNDAVKGCSGGPMFTEDYQLIGIYTNSSKQPLEGNLRHCIGRRIDLCLPRLLYPQIEWDRLLIHPQPEQMPDPVDRGISSRPPSTGLEASKRSQTGGGPKSG